MNIFESFIRKCVFCTSFLEDKTFVEMLEAHIALLVKRLLAGKTVTISFAEKSELGNSLSM